MNQTGRVVSLNGDMATVQIQRVTSCGDNCASCKGGCSPTQMFVEAENSVNASVGQYVKLKTETKTVMKAAFLVYIVPLLGLVIGIFLGIALGDSVGYSNEIVGIVMGLIFLIASYLLIYFLDKRINKNNSIRVYILSVIS